ncbi:hypothetical protein [Xanthomonas arboricola]|uniref:hypothetical protein n=1 Tax=Xanthomonas arboricola TaxID=56448 RepID=UPI0011B0BD8F|nr:hypothetical protein [Xanthomonas arboricola]
MANTTIVAGVVGGDGVKQKGEGYTSSRSSEGWYTVSFNADFTSIYGASVTQVFKNDHGKTTDNAIIQSIDISTLQVRTGKSDGNLDDRSFSFIAYGEI